MKWSPCERLKVDRVACPWTILRFIDLDTGFLYVRRLLVMRIAAQQQATPFDVLKFSWTTAATCEVLTRAWWRASRAERTQPARRKWPVRHFGRVVVAQFNDIH
jgi:hypothetical protein